MPKSKLAALVEQNPEKMIEAFTDLLSAASYFQELSSWANDEMQQVIPELHALHANIILRSYRLSDLLSE